MKTSARLAMTALAAFLLAAAASSQTTTTDSAATTPPTAASPDTAATPASHLSKVRIVRISEIRGAVQLDRSNGRGYEAAVANLPVVEGNRLKTAMGVAEIELEDNSTVRLGVDSEVEFPQLARSSDGATVSTVHVLKGMAYVSLVKAKTPNRFDLTFADRSIAVPPGAHFRLDMTNDAAKVAVFDGNIQVNGPGGSVDLAKKKSATLLLAAPEIRPDVAGKIEELPLDSWDKQATQYHARVASFGAFGNSPYAYGVNDMMYYGAFSNVGGCGSMWRPYFASAAWDPYANGSWAFYQGAGYSWVSPYPWGWTPYHYGSWNYCAGAGWGWMPGGGWYGLDNTSYYNNAGYGGGSGGSTMRLHGPIGPPVKAPHPGQPTLFPVSHQPLVHNELQSGNSFVFKRDSAGMGIPRDGTLGKLDHFSVQAVNKGTAQTPVYLSVGSGVQSPGGNGRGNATAMVTMHRGTPPAFGGMTSPAMGGSGGGGGGMRGGSAGSSMGSGSSSMGGHAGGGGPAPSPSSHK